jgi:hypothetical protein
MTCFFFRSLSRSLNSGENAFVVLLFTGGYAGAMALLALTERFASPERYWSFVLFFRLGAVSLYYLYYRSIFLQVPSTYAAWPFVCVCHETVS